jgi:DNA adenine methylase
MFIEPVIKWSGSKRVVAPRLKELLPDGKRYYEPFVGGGAMLPFRKIHAAAASDVIAELICLWELIRDMPESVASEYEKRWSKLQSDGYGVYYEIRKSFNKTRNPHDLLFLTRTCVNGLIRFNNSGDFNNSLHHTRPGIAPARLRQIILEWSVAIRDVKFMTCDYRQTLSAVKTGDVVFLDPPYAGTKGRYMPSKFNLTEFYDELERLNSIGAKWVLTFDGKAGERSYLESLDKSLYKVKLALPTGNSPFTKLMKTSLDRVMESVYLNFEPSPKALRQFANRRFKPSDVATSFDVQQGRLFG